MSGGKAIIEDVGADGARLVRAGAGAAERDAAATARIARSGRSAASAGSVARNVSALRSQAEAFEGDVGAMAASAERGGAVSSAARTENLSKSSSEIKSSSRTTGELSSAGKQAEAEAKAASKGWTTTEKLAGVGGVVLISFAIASYVATNGAIIDITSMAMNSPTTAIVHYNVHSGSGGPSFALRPGDLLTFSAAGPSYPDLATEDKKIVDVQGNHVVIIEVPQGQTLGGIGYVAPTPSSSSSSSPSPAAPTGSAYWGQATVTSSMESQLGGAVGDATDIAATAAAAGLDSAITSLAPGVAAAAQAALNAATPVLDAGLDAGGKLLDKGFCAIVPFLCNTTMLWVIGGICLALVILGLVLKFKKH